MADPTGEAPAAAAAAAPASRTARRPAAAEVVAPPEPAEPGADASAQPDGATGGADGSDQSDGDSDIFHGRPDLSQNTIEDLRTRHRALKAEQKTIKRQLKNQGRKRARVIKRMRNLDTAAVLQVLMDRGVDFTRSVPSVQPAALPPAAPAPAAAAPAAIAGPADAMAVS